jgi:hypothetical protein
MGWDVFNALVEQMKDIEFEQIQTSGNGEAFLNPNYLDYISILRKEFPNHTMWTYNNFSQWTPERTRRIVDEGLFDRVHVRIDSLKKWIFEKASNLNQETVFNNLIYFLEYNKDIPVTILYNNVNDYYERCRRVLNKRPARDYFTDDELSRIPDEEQAILDHFQALSDVPIDMCRIGHSLWGERTSCEKDGEAKCPKFDIISSNIWVCPNGDTSVCCYSKDTEVFTDEGWKLFPDLTGNELVLSRKSDGDTEWVDIVDMQKYKYEGELYTFDSKDINLQVTPEHKFPLIPKAKYESKHATRTPKELRDGYVWKEVQNFKLGNYKIPRVFNWEGDGSLTEKYSLEFMELLGWFLTEGCTRLNKWVDTRKRIDGSCSGKERQSKQNLIYQSKDSIHYDEIKDVIMDNGYHPIQDTRSWNITDNDLFDMFKPLGLSHEKYIPEEVKNLPKEYLEILLDTMIKGDGSFYKTGNRYYTTSEKLANDVQEIAYKCGYVAWIKYRKPRINEFNKEKMCRPQYDVYISKSGKVNHLNINTATRHIKKVEYNDYVYDITLSRIHTLWVRRNGKAVWSSNCYDDRQSDFICGNIMEEHLGDIFNGSRRAEILDNIDKRVYKDYPCTNPLCCKMGD